MTSKSKCKVLEYCILKKHEQWRVCRLKHSVTRICAYRANSLANSFSTGPRLYRNMHQGGRGKTTTLVPSNCCLHYSGDSPTLHSLLLSRPDKWFDFMWDPLSKEVPSYPQESDQCSEHSCSKAAGCHQDILIHLSVFSSSFATNSFSDLEQGILSIQVPPDVPADGNPSFFQWLLSIS